MLHVMGWVGRPRRRGRFVDTGREASADLRANGGGTMACVRHMAARFLMPIVGLGDTAIDDAAVKMLFPLSMPMTWANTRLLTQLLIGRYSSGC